MQLNPKLIQYSLQVKYCQSKIIQDQHNQHLKKLSQIKKNKSNLEQIKRQTQSLKKLSQTLHRYHEISRSFKVKEVIDKRSQQDIKMIRCMSEINKNKQKQVKSQSEEFKNFRKFKQRKEVHHKVANLIKSKQLDEENFKIGLRISRQQNDYSYVNRIKKDIKEYFKVRNNMTRIKQVPLPCSQVKKNAQKKRTATLFTENQNEANQFPNNKELLKNRQKRAKTQQHLNTETCEDDSTEFLFDVLKKNPSEILQHRISQNAEAKRQQQIQKQICLPQINTHKSERSKSSRRYDRNQGK